MATIAVVDETTRGTREAALSLDFLTEQVTAREILRARIYQEVTEHNRTPGGRFRGLVQPEAVEQALNPARPVRRIDWEAQYAHALRAFETNGLILLVDDRQVETLDEPVTLRAGATVTFLRLVPLVGG